LRRSHRLGSWLRRIATYDVFPGFSARVRRLLYNPLGVLLMAALAGLLCGFFLHPQGFVLCGGVAAVVVLGVLWPWLTLRGLSGSLSFDRPRAVEGDQVEVCLTLKNHLPWSALGLVVRQGFDRDAKDRNLLPPVASIASAPPRRAARCHWSFVPPWRGVYPLTLPRLASGFPFGLWENSRPLHVENPLLVWPRTFAVGPVPLVSGDHQVEGNVSRNRVGSNGDVLGVRPYRRGDSPRRIHWGQSARHDRLIVCELQANARPVIQLVLDTDPQSHFGDGPDSSREWAIRIAASLGKGWLEAGAQVGAVWNGEVFPPDSGQPQSRRLLDSLARLPEASGPTIADTLRMPACRGFREGLQVIVTTDAAQVNLPPSQTQDGLQRWVVLRTRAFGDCGLRIADCGLAEESANRNPQSEIPTGLLVRPWLVIDAVERIPALLRGGWKEAQHGT
jgi:uncharacterized protein (DUF58 family)